MPVSAEPLNLVYSNAYTYAYNLNKEYINTSTTNEVQWFPINWDPGTTGLLNTTLWDDQGTTIHNTWAPSTAVTQNTIGGYILVNNIDWVYTPTPSDKKAMKRWELKSKLAIHVKSRSDSSVFTFAPTAERTAMETLREMITEAEFRRYVRDGFIMVRGRSGDMYQVFRHRSHTKIWRNGKVIEEVCTRIRADIGTPPTDNVIAFKTMIEFDEQEFKSVGNIYRMAA